MSYQNGWAALHLEMTDKIPRTEYSASEHWKLVSRVTGIAVTSLSPPQLQARASEAFRRAWDYGYDWRILTHNQIFDGKYTKMGHGVYASDGADFSNETMELFDDPEDALRLDPFQLYGARDPAALTAEFNRDYHSVADQKPDYVPMTGIYVTLMSGLLEILGWDMLLTCAGVDPKGFGALTNRYGNWIQQYFDALAKSDAPVVMVHDDIVWTSGPFVHPEFYRSFLFPNYKKLFAPLAEQGKVILYTSDGNYTQFVDDIAACGVSGFVLEPCTDMRMIAEKYGKTHSFTGNFDTRVLLSGTREDIDREMRRCMEIGRKYPGFFLAVGNHIPANTPVENALYYNDLYERYSRR